MGGTRRLGATAVVAGGFVLLCLLLVALAPPDRPVYALDGRLVFTAPNPSGEANALRSQDADVIYFAAAVEREFNGRPQTARLASTEATLYGTGVRDGASVSLVDRGGQWQSSFDRPYLRVEVAAPSAAEAQSRFAAVVGRLETLASGRQRAAGVPVGSMVTLELAPDVPRVQAVAGSPVRALAAAVLLAAMGGLGILSAGTRLGRARLRHASARAHGALDDLQDASLRGGPGTSGDGGGGVRSPAG